MNWLKYDEIEALADEFLKTHHPDLTIPIPIENIVELKLQISIVPISLLLKNEGIDAFISHDFTELYIDHDHYMGQSNRSRFTLAHEVAHMVLHKEVVSSIDSIDKWKKFILGEGTGRAVFEIQADDFAGCLLMPRELVLKEFNLLKQAALVEFKTAGLPAPEDKLLVSFTANKIAKLFEVSAQSAEIRLKKVLL